MNNLVMKRLIYISVTVTLFLGALVVFPVKLNAQIVADKAFNMKSAKTGEIQKQMTFTRGEVTIPLALILNITGLSVSGSIVFENEKGFVRITLKDTFGSEHLVLETNAVLENDARITFQEFCEETALLSDVTPESLNVECVDAVLTLNKISYTDDKKAFAKDVAEEIKLSQVSAKIKQMNDVLAAKKITWGAGETSLSKMTYEEKKSIFGGKVPNLAGYDYYINGIFVMPSFEPSGAPKSSPYVSSWDWRNRHGRNWLTPAKDQYFPPPGCGSCWAFAAVSATEAYAGLYYNRLLNLDLSEQDLLSCSGAGTCSGGGIGSSLDYIINTGVVNESCFPYIAQDALCNGKCLNPSERIKIGGSTYFSSQLENEIKSLLFKAPLCFALGWGPNVYHAVTIIGYKTIQVGDMIYIENKFENRTVTISAGHPLVGTDAWIIKNSFGSSWGVNGFGLIVTNLSETDGYSITGAVTSLKYTNSDIVCEDRDGDGYYYWGLGPKPSTCPSCAPDEPDGDDSNPCLGPMDEYGNCSNLCPGLSITGPDVICMGQYYTFTVNNPPPGSTWWNSNNLTPVASTGNNKTFYVNCGSYCSPYASVGILPAGSNFVQATKSAIVNEPPVINLEEVNFYNNTGYYEIDVKSGTTPIISYDWYISGAPSYYYSISNPWPERAMISFSVTNYYYNLTASASNMCGAGYDYKNIYVGFKGGSSTFYYPNPVDKILSIDLVVFSTENPPEDTPTIDTRNPFYDVRLYDGQGNLLRQQQAKGGTVQFNVSNLPNGIYYLHVYDGKSNIPFIQQIMVEH